MGFIKGLFPKKIENKYGPTDDYWYLPVIGKTNAGKDINEVTALNYSAVWLAITFIAQTIGSLPMNLYSEVDEKKEKVFNNIYKVVGKAPNPYMPAMTFWETFIAHVVSWGNGYAEKELDRSGRVKALWPIPPHRVTPRIEDGQVIYEVKVDQDVLTLPKHRMFHIPGIGYDGLVGYSVIQKARETIGLGVAAEDFQARFFGQGAHPGLVVTHPLSMGVDTHKKLENSLSSKYEGLGRAHRMMLLDEGMTVEKIGISQVDAQFLESRVFSINEVARWFNLPNHILKDLSEATYSNIENQSQELVKYSLRPWMVRLEQHCNLQLLPATAGANLFFKWDADDLLRGDSESRAALYKSLWEIGGMTPNEIRSKEDLNPINGGDTAFVPMNFMPLDKAIERTYDETTTDREQLTGGGGDEQTDD